MADTFEEDLNANVRPAVDSELNTIQESQIRNWSPPPDEQTDHEEDDPHDKDYTPDNGQLSSDDDDGRIRSLGARKKGNVLQSDDEEPAASQRKETSIGSDDETDIEVVPSPGHGSSVSTASKKLSGVKRNRAWQSLLNVTPLNKKNKESETSNHPARQSDSTPLKIPQVVDACFTEYRVNGTNREATCVQCKVIIKAGLTSTSNWVRHINEVGHELSAQKYKAHKEGRKTPSTTSSTSLKDYFPPQIQKWQSKSGEQIEMRAAWVDAIIMCSLPLTVVENPYFRKALEISQPRFNHINRKSILTDLTKRYDNIQMILKERLREVENVSVTVDLWSDRKMRSYMGVTVHYLHGNELKSGLLCCVRITGSHTGGNIKGEFRQICVEFEISDKVSYIISDNASNMRKAFEVHFMVNSEGNAEDETVCDEEIWCDESISPDEISTNMAVHIRCFAHSLQLCVRDGLKVIRSLSVLGKCSRIATLLHTSISFKEAFTKEFGEQTGISQPNDTRWNSMFTHLQAIAKLEQGKLNRTLDAAKSVNCKLTAKEHSTLLELIAILKPFYEITQRTQGEKMVTISVVAPAVMQLRKALQPLPSTSLTKLKNSLLSSLLERFSGIFHMMDPDKIMDEKLPFGNRIYMLSAVLDPNWGARWLEYISSPSNLSELKTRVKGLLEAEMETEEFLDTMTNSQPSFQSQHDPSSIFADFHDNSLAEGASVSQSSEIEISTILTAVSSKKVDAIKHWCEERNLARLKPLALKYLSTPATSAPIERVFSVGGHIFSPKRGRLLGDNLTKLMVVKCNAKV